MTISTLVKPENTSPLSTGPTQLSGVEKTSGIWPEIEKQAQSDPKAVALLELKQLIKDEILTLKEEGKSFKQDLGDYQKSLKRVDNLLIGIVVVTSLAFITTLSLVFFDLIKEKELYLQNNNLYQKYSDQNNEQKIQINDLDNELKMLRVKNPYLK